MQILSRAATRIDLAGGTVDLWPLYLFLENGLTINAAIDLYAIATIQPLPNGRIELYSKDQDTSVSVPGIHQLSKTERLALLCRIIHYFAPREGFRLETNATAPAGSGLGGSSTLSIAVCGALNEFTGAGIEREELVGISRDIEAQVLQIPTGEQDYYAAAYGGLSAWHFDINRVERRTYDVPLEELQQRIVLFYSGLPRSSGINNWQVFKQYVDGDAATREALGRIRAETHRLDSALRKGDWSGVAAAVAAEWDARKKLAPSITTPGIDEILEFGRDAGAAAGKVCGAGGGGCLFLICAPERKAFIMEEARRRGYRLLDFQFVRDGLTVTRS